MFPSLRLATKEAERLNEATGLDYSVVSAPTGEWFKVVRFPTPNMCVWRTITDRRNKKINFFLDKLDATGYIIYNNGENNYV